MVQSIYRRKKQMQQIKDTLARMQAFYEGTGKKKLFSGIIIAALIVLLPAVVFQATSNKSKTIKSQASEDQVELFFGTPESPTPLTALTAAPGETKTLALYLDTKRRFVNGYDVNIAVSGLNNITLTSTVEGRDSSKFDTSIFNAMDPASGTIRFAKVGVNSTIVQGILNLGSITFQMKPGSGSINFTIPNYQITSPGSTQALAANSPPLTITYPVTITPLLVADLQVSNDSFTASSVSCADTGRRSCQGKVNQGINFTGNVINYHPQSPQLDKMEIWAAYQDKTSWGNNEGCAAVKQPWCLVKSENIGGGSVQINAQWIPKKAGSYFVVINAYDKEGDKCSGNPFETLPGWTRCSPDNLNKDLIQITVTGSAAIPTAAPTIAPTAAPTITPTTAPLSLVPTATISGPTNGTVNTPLAFSGTARGSSLKLVEIYALKHNTTAWIKAGSQDCGGRSSCNITANFTPPQTGSWYVVINAHSTGLPWCSGNPGRVLANNLSACAPGSGDLINLTVAP